MQIPNTDTIVYVNGRLVRKSEAVISIYDSGFCHGDGAYEGIRLYDGKVFRLEAHIRRLFEALTMLDIDPGVDQAGMIKIVRDTFAANELTTDLHMRLQVTRGRKRMTGMNPMLNLGPASIVAFVDHKPPIFDKAGITLITSTLRRASPNVIDAKIHHTNQLNQILANIEANRQGADEAIMLDDRGFVAETNSTTMFCVKDGVLMTPHPTYIVVGITRGILLQMAVEEGWGAKEADLSVYDFVTADEVFICGTVGELVPVKAIDGRALKGPIPGPVTVRLMEKYRALTRAEGTAV
ncbi:aminotransferase class IV [Thalassobaculum litoreum]|uniref:Probable branched-chain-amino-acid aminotransferase n=1 Tax=Thalassobaculum litoreum DSM 18839 TaxID=1123362 RepID=A0A8G2BLW0_9PROT|nr:aminotransferase class IV [Thalassobaculum litoreum]SDG02279.1 branched-chain amino acid aminotransferase [Thalassobaculum litoreum DSM 18839]